MIKLTAENFTARLKQVNLATEGDIADFIKKKKATDLNINIEIKSINKKVTSNKSKHLLAQNEF